MDFLRRLFGGKSNASSDDTSHHMRLYYVKGKKCGAITRLRIDMRNDLSRTDEDDNVFYVRKVVVDNICYGQVEVELRFDSNYRELARIINGGDFVDKAAWDAAQSSAS
jgi:hypothetical protein